MELEFSTDADLGDAQLRVVGGHGYERLSEVYRYTILVESTAGLDESAIDDLLRQPAHLTIGAHAATIHGVLEAVTMHSALETGAIAYELVLVPRLTRLGLTHRSRVVAQDKTQLEALKAVLDAHSIDYEDLCRESYAPSEYVVQHDETDLAFVLRLLERNGIHFAFRQDDEHETLLLADANGAYASTSELEQLRYDPVPTRPGDASLRVTALQRTRRPATARVVLREYDWRAPAQQPRADADADQRSGAGVWDLYGEHWRESSEGRRLARMRAEEYVLRGDAFSGQATVRAMRPGMWFELDGHPIPDLNRRYLVTGTSEQLVAHEAGYTKHFDTIAFDLAYRPALMVPWPRIEGLITAIVDGEASATATPIDDRGRYRVVFPQHGGARPGGRATRWVRCAQPSAGAGYGMHLPLHIGTEVIVAHVNGDPDRPVIIGAVPNASTETPVRAANATQSRIRTGSGVVFELDDDC
jgi:type VI secretion system secreted protein VgrG